MVLITGGTSGIGRATALAFAEHGANVVVAGRREAEGAESVKLVEKIGGNCLFIRTYVAIEKEVEAMVARAVEYFGRLDFAFNNAGVSGGEMDSGNGIANTNEFFNRIMDTNVRGVFFSLKHEIPAILKSGGGGIVNNASVAGLRAIIAGTPIYTASKFAVVGLTRSVALEFAAKGVRVNAVCPAIIETEMTEKFGTNNELRAKTDGDAPNRPVWAIGRGCGSGALSLLAGSCIHHRSCITCGWRCPRVNSRNRACVISIFIPDPISSV